MNWKVICRATLSVIKSGFATIDAANAWYEAWIAEHDYMIHDPEFAGVDFIPSNA